MKPKARVNPEGYMGSASREHKVKKGKGDGERKSAKDRDLEELAMHIMDEDEMDEF